MSSDQTGSDNMCQVNTDSTGDTVVPRLPHPGMCDTIQCKTVFQCSLNFHAGGFCIAVAALACQRMNCRRAWASLVGKSTVPIMVRWISITAVVWYQASVSPQRATNKSPAL